MLSTEATSVVSETRASTSIDSATRYADTIKLITAHCVVLS